VPSSRPARAESGGASEAGRTAGGGIKPRHTIAVAAPITPLVRNTARHPKRFMVGAISSGAMAAPKAAVAM